MANDRVMIRCDSCGGWKMLLKHFAGIGPKARGNEILEWLDSHAECHPNFEESDLGGSPGFSLHTEGSPSLKPEKQNQKGNSNKGDMRQCCKNLL